MRALGSDAAPDAAIAFAVGPVDACRSTSVSYGTKVKRKRLTNRVGCVRLDGPGRPSGVDDARAPPENLRSG